MNGVTNIKLITKHLNFLIQRNGFDRIFDKVNITSVVNGQCTATLIVDNQHTNGYNTLHGGFIASAIDLYSSIALITHPRIVENLESTLYSGVSVNINVSYLAAAKIGDEVVINAETIKVGKNLAYLKATLIRKEDNAILAHGSHTKFIKM